jgi:hypothetical protein
VRRGPIGPPLLERPAVQKVIKLTEFRKISYSTGNISALKLFSSVLSRKAFF